MKPPTLEEGLRALEEATELAKSIRIDLDDDYLRTIALTEALPGNQSGSDKTWVGRLLRASAEHFKGAIRVR
jgi:hypothetical protein